MKKLIYILVINLFLTSSSHSSEFKIRRIECNDPDQKRFWNKFFLIDNDNKSALMIRAIDFYNFQSIKVNIDADINLIKFNYNNNQVYRIVRSNGDLINKHNTWVGKCFKMDDDFEPYKFLSIKVNTNIEEREKKNKF